MQCSTRAWDSVLDTFMWGPPAPTYSGEEAWVRRTPGGALYGMWGEPEFGRPLVVWLHGNAGDVGESAGNCEAYARMLDAVLVAPEYAGFGPRASGGGGPSLAHTLRDCEDVYNHVAALPSSKVVLMGHSIGAGIAMELQRTLQVGRTVLFAPFLSCLSLDLRPLAVALPALDRLRSYEAAPLARRPVLIVHGSDDDVIPVAHGAELNGLVPFRHRRDFVRVDGAGHADVLTRWQDYGPRLRAFLAEQ